MRRRNDGRVLSAALRRRRLVEEGDGKAVSAGVRGFLTIGHWDGVPVRLHWSVPFGVVIFTGFSLGGAIGFVALLLLHEVGHAVLVRRQRLTVTEIRVYGFGAECEYRGWPTRLGKSVIAWGGVLMQAALLVAANGVVALFGTPHETFARDALAVFGEANAFILIVNLLPIAPLDGAEAWLLFPRLWRRLWR